MNALVDIMDMVYMSVQYYCFCKQINMNASMQHMYCLEAWTIWLYVLFVCFTLNLQVKDNLFGTKAIAGHTSVIPRILSFHCADYKAAITMDTATTIDHNWRRASIAKTNVHKDKQKEIRQHAQRSCIVSYTLCIHTSVGCRAHCVSKPVLLTAPSAT